MHPQRREVVPRQIVAEVCGAVHNHSPTTQPLPENVLSVTFEPPFRCLPAIMDKEHGQHLRIGHDAQKFCVIAQLHKVIGRGGGGAGQPERRIGEKVDDLIAHFARKGFQDAGFIQNYG